MQTQALLPYLCVDFGETKTKLKIELLCGEARRQVLSDTHEGHLLTDLLMTEVQLIFRRADRYVAHYRHPEKFNRFMSKFVFDYKTIL